MSVRQRTPKAATPSRAASSCRVQGGTPGLPRSWEAPKVGGPFFPQGSPLPRVMRSKQLLLWPAQNRGCRRHTGGFKATSVTQAASGTIRPQLSSFLAAFSPLSSPSQDAGGALCCLEQLLQPCDYFHSVSIPRFLSLLLQLSLSGSR